jgi:starch phosphorylase
VLDDEGNRLLCQVEINLPRYIFKRGKSMSAAARYICWTRIAPKMNRFIGSTLRVYGGDNSTRIMQEVLLGLGGVRLLHALKIEPSLYHMNEACGIYLAGAYSRRTGKAARLMKRWPGPGNAVFSPHTPVDAGHDRFGPDLMKYALKQIQPKITASFEDFYGAWKSIPKTSRSLFA